MTNPENTGCRTPDDSPLPNWERISAAIRWAINATS
jgi:hypothetical protein